MKKIVLFALFLTWLLAACSTAETPSQVEEPETEDVAPTATAVSGTAATGQELDNDITPATTPAEANITRDRDWTKGASDPTIVIVEYGDFQ